MAGHSVGRCPAGLACHFTCARCRCCFLTPYVWPARCPPTALPPPADAAALEEWAKSQTAIVPDAAGDKVQQAMAEVAALAKEVSRHPPSQQQLLAGAASRSSQQEQPPQRELPVHAALSAACTSLRGASLLRLPALTLGVLAGWLATWCPACSAARGWHPPACPPALPMTVLPVLPACRTSLCTPSSLLSACSASWS